MCMLSTVAVGSVNPDDNLDYNSIFNPDNDNDNENGIVNPDDNLDDNPILNPG